MSMRLLSFFFVLSLSLPAAAQTGDEDISLSRVRASGMSIRVGQATAVTPSSIDEVDAIVRDYARYHEFLPNFQVSRVLAERGARAMIYLEISILYDTATLWCQLRMTSRTEDDGRRIIATRYMDGNVERFHARWELRPTEDGGTEVTLQLGVDPGVPVPDSAVTDENVRVARKGLRALLRRVAALHA